ncbi:hypothetical protein H9X78_05845 [Clostridium saudiense]|nr:hypothetical protein [Clostridium saudiense]
MKGTILDYTPTEAFILLEDDSVVTIPLSSFTHTTPIGSNISLTRLYNGTYSINYKPSKIYDKSIDFF